MATLIENMIDVVTNQANLYEELLAMSEDKKEILIHKNVEKLNELTTKETTIVKKIKRFGEREQEIMKDMTMVINKNIETVYDLINVLPKQEDKDQLKFQLDKKVNVAIELKKANEQNMKLLDSANTAAEFTMNLMLNEISRKPTILDTKGEDITINRPFFDARQ